MRPFVNRGLRRLTYVSTADHGYTFASLLPALESRGIAARGLSWERLMRARSAAAGAWVLTDFDRLSPTEQEVAGLIAARLRDAGLPLLNDPRQFRPRHALLADLRAAGLNTIPVWTPAAGEWPERFPVLERTIAAHRGPFGTLIDTSDAVDIALGQAMAAGHVLADLIFVGFAAEATVEGLWQKHAAFRIGSRIIRANTVSQGSWAAKEGTRGAAPAAFYGDELAEMTDYPHADHVRAVFDHAGLEFGRMDFGIVADRIETYEINTNPFFPAPRPHPDPSRMRTMQLMQDQLADALAAVTPPAGGQGVNLSGLFPRSSRWYRWRPRRM